jgi:hypothetical protein
VFSFFFVFFLFPFLISETMAYEPFSFSVTDLFTARPPLLYDYICLPFQLVHHYAMVCNEVVKQV